MAMENDAGNDAPYQISDTHTHTHTHTHIGDRRVVIVGMRNTLDLVFKYRQRLTNFCIAEGF